MGVVVSTATRARAGHGVKEGVTEGWWLFAARSTLGNRSLGPGVSRGLWEAGWLQEWGEAGASRQQSGGRGQWSGRCWWSCARTGPSLGHSDQCQVVDDV